MGNVIENAGEKSCTCEAHGGADRSSRRDLPRRCKDIRALSCSRTDRARSDAPASMCRPRTHRTRAPIIGVIEWHTMGDKCIPPVPNQLLTAILVSTMQSSCLFRLSSVDCAACVHRSTAAQPCPGPRWTQSRILEGNDDRVINLSTSPPPLCGVGGGHPRLRQDSSTISALNLPCLYLSAVH